MLALEVSINGKRRYVAGHRDARMLTVWVHGNLAIPGSISFGMLGTVAIPGKAEGELDTLSYAHDALSLGDEVVVRLVDVGTPDTPDKPDDKVYRIEIESRDG
jgi:hypothetical protein